MIESFLTRSPAPPARSANTIFPQESLLAALQSDTIIEHESSSRGGAGGVEQCFNKSGHSHSLGPASQAISSR